MIRDRLSRAIEEQMSLFTGISLGYKALLDRLEPQTLLILDNIYKTAPSKREVLETQR